MGRKKILKWSFYGGAATPFKYVTRNSEIDGARQKDGGATPPSFCYYMVRRKSVWSVKSDKEIGWGKHVLHMVVIGEISVRKKPILLVWRQQQLLRCLFKNNDA